MMSMSAAIHLLGTSKSTTSSTGSEITLLVLVGIVAVGYFAFWRPQSQKAKAARAAQGSGIEVGDEVQTIGGVIGTVLEVHGDRYTLLTGALNTDGNLDGPQPTRIVFVRQAIARKVDPLVPANPADANPTVSASSSSASDLDVRNEADAEDGAAASENHTSAEAAHDSAESHDGHDGEAEAESA